MNTFGGYTLRERMLSRRYLKQRDPEPREPSSARGLLLMLLFWIPALALISAISVMVFILARAEI
jgi:hypothetical protein